MSPRILLLGLFLVAPAVRSSGQEPPRRPRKPGVEAKELRIPMSRLVPDAVFPVAGAPDWLAIDDSVFVASEPANSVARLDVTTNKVAKVIKVGKEPGSGLAIGFGSLWVPCCGDPALVRVDLATNAITARIETTIANSEGGIAVGDGSVWLLTDAKGTLARVDPATNAIATRIQVPAGSFAVAFGEEAAWITGTESGVLTRVDPKTNAVAATIAVGPHPRFLAIGAGAVWTFNQGDGSITRVDPAKNEVVATIEAGLPGGGGEIAVGEGSVWVTSFGFPITRIDPATNKVAQQFVGPGGDSIRIGHGSIWLSNLREQNVWRLDPRRVEAARAGD